MTGNDPRQALVSIDRRAFRDDRRESHGAGEGVAGDFFEDGNGRAVGEDHGFAGHEEGLLVSKLAFQHRVAD